MNKHILKGLNLNIKPGEVHAIMGPMDLEKHIIKYFIRQKWLRNKWYITFNGENLLELSTEEKEHKDFLTRFNIL